MQLREVECTNCGASVVWDGTYSKTVTCSYCQSTFMPAATTMEDAWLMTDPVARARYQSEGKLDKLEHDIRFEVMRGGNWSISDRAYLSEITRLEDEGAVRKLASFWAVSPHPPIYRALTDGDMNIRGKLVQFRKGDEIVWACPMTRDRFELDLPLLTGDFNDARMKRLCGDMTNAMQARML